MVMGQKQPGRPPTGRRPPPPPPPPRNPGIGPSTVQPPDVAKLRRERRERAELLAALKKTFDAFETADRMNWDERGIGPYRMDPEMLAVRAVIAKHEG
jgi:hypothetical protein